jgi:hypothetical protein
MLYGYAHKRPRFVYRKLYLNRTLRTERAEDDWIGALHSVMLLFCHWLRK